MRFNCGPSFNVKAEETYSRFSNWHRWYAWFPVRVGEDDCRWLEWIERRGESASYKVHKRFLSWGYKDGSLSFKYSGFGWKWEYRALQTVVTVKPA